VVLSPWKRSFCASRQDRSKTVSCGAALVQFVGPATASKPSPQEHRQRQDRVPTLPSPRKKKHRDGLPSPFPPLPDRHGVGTHLVPGTRNRAASTQREWQRASADSFGVFCFLRKGQCRPVTSVAGVAWLLYCSDRKQPAKVGGAGSFRRISGEE
jgi:hypothetical protein